MHDLRNTPRRERKINIRGFFKKLKWKHLIYLLIIIILFFPTVSGTIIGNWIVDFLGTIISIING